MAVRPLVRVGTQTTRRACLDHPAIQCTCPHFLSNEPGSNNCRHYLLNGHFTTGRLIPPGCVNLPVDWTGGVDTFDVLTVQDS